RDALVAQAGFLEAERLGRRAELQVRRAVEPEADVLQVLLDVRQRERHGAILWRPVGPRLDPMASIAPDVREIRMLGNRRFLVSGVVLVALAAALPPSDTAVAGRAGTPPPTATLVSSLLYSRR